MSAVRVWLSPDKQAKAAHVFFLLPHRRQRDEKMIKPTSLLSRALTAVQSISLCSWQGFVFTQAKAPHPEFSGVLRGKLLKQRSGQARTLGVLRERLSKGEFTRRSQLTGLDHPDLKYKFGGAKFLGACAKFLATNLRLRAAQRIEASH